MNMFSGAGGGGVGLPVGMGGLETMPEDVDEDMDHDEDVEEAVATKKGPREVNGSGSGVGKKGRKGRGKVVKREEVGEEEGDVGMDVV